ncbi:flagellar export protein FliJ [Clostridium tetani]|uniref:flagellar export protein FliJ n=1 Tax=Clostridium tetani TaxID=1513 RepID=UPI00100BA648|nr:flagellar export protein FliJ [Clostridium tetani]RXI37470.1 flagellar export protein FliJ [Clostridium tetani]
MKGYKFNLQKLLDIRKDREEQCKIQFQNAQKLKMDIENKLISLKDSYRRYSSEISEESVVNRKIRHQYLINVSHNIELTIEELKKREAEVEKVRISLKQKQIERKTVETLREKDKNAFIKEQNLLEQKANDEFALYGFVRNLERR